MINLAEKPLFINKLHKLIRHNLVILKKSLCLNYENFYSYCNL